MEASGSRGDTKSRRCRRDASRVRWNGAANLWQGTYRISCVGIDLGVGGIQVESSWGIYPGQAVVLDFNLFGHRGHLEGVVVWAGLDDRQRWGVRFAEVPEDVGARFREFIDRSGPDAATADVFGDEEPTRLFGQPARLPAPPPFGCSFPGCPPPPGMVRTGDTVVATVPGFRQGTPAS